MAFSETSNSSKASGQAGPPDTPVLSGATSTPNAPCSSAVALEFKDVAFSYRSSAPVLSGASFSVREGEVVALVGNNGSGKSTAARLAGAFLLPSGGQVKVFGKDVAKTIETKGADGALGLRQNVGFVFQNPDDQLVASVVVDEVAFGPSNLGLPREEVAKRVQESLEAVGMLDSLGCNVNTLSGGQKQRIAMADALAMRPKLMVLDEPTSMLDEQGRRDVRDIVHRLRRAGMAVLWITHSREEAEAADRALVVKDGLVVQAAGSDLPFPPRRVRARGEGRPRRSMQAKAAAGSDARSIGDGTCPSRPSLKTKGCNTAESEIPGRATRSPEALIRFRDASFAYSSKNERGIDIFSQSKGTRPVFESVCLEVLPGELLAITGPNGCGKSTLLQHMNGLLAPTSGEVLVCGRPTSTKEGANAARRNVGLCLQYPERSLFSQTVRDEVAFGPRNMGLEGLELETRVREAMEMFDLPYDEYAGRNPFALSGGEQRKVALAGVAAMQRKVLVLDEPCSGLDAPSHDRMVGLIEKMKEDGQTMVMVTHDADDVRLLADRVFDMG